jgi:hypothetical protein
LTLFHEGIYRATRYVIILIGDNIQKYELNNVEHKLAVFFIGNNNKGAIMFPTFCNVCFNTRYRK